MMDMMQKLAALMPQAKNEDHLAEIAAAQIGPPPNLGFTGMAPPSGQMMMQPASQSPFANRKPSMVPPMGTRGENATRIGSYILGGQ